MNIRQSSIDKVLAFSKELKEKEFDKLSSVHELQVKYHVAATIPHAMKLMNLIIMNGRAKTINYVKLEPHDARQIIIRANNYNKDLLKGFTPKVKELAGVMNLCSFSDQDLFAELKRRGYSGDISKKFVI